MCTCIASAERVGRGAKAPRSRSLRRREHGLLKAIERVVKQKIEPARIPSLADVRARRIAALTAAIRETLVADAFEPYRVAVQSLAEEYDGLDIAAAAAKLAAEATHGQQGDEVPEVIDAGPVRGSREQRQPPRNAAGPRRDGTRAPKRRSDGMTRLVVTIGQHHGVRPKDIVGAIANEAKIPGDAIGAIEIGDEYSLVEVREAQAEKVIRALSRATMRGQRVSARRESES